MNLFDNVYVLGVMTLNNNVHKDLQDFYAKNVYIHRLDLEKLLMDVLTVKIFKNYY